MAWRELAEVPDAERDLTRLREVMRPAEALVTLHPADTCWQAFRAMGERGVNQLPVLERGKLVGALTRERLIQLVQSALALASQAGSR